mmetsp:Transcript_20710/g.59377  ORF Transcript_20710/g.59377 Transcript_20710/m.59377 type:complete len:232 (+) Transcript_20710:2049-2744(+)
MRRGSDAALQAAHRFLHPRPAILLVALLPDPGLPGRQLSHQPVLPPAPLGPNNGGKVSEHLLPVQRRVVLELRRTSQIDQRVDPDLVHEEGQVGLGGVGNAAHPVDGGGPDGTSGHAGQVAGVLHLLEGEVALLAQGLGPGEEGLLLLGELDVVDLRRVNVVVSCRRYEHGRGATPRSRGGGPTWRGNVLEWAAAATPRGAAEGGPTATGRECRYGAAADRGHRCGSGAYC